MRSKLLAPLIGSFALVPIVGCEVLLVSGHLGSGGAGGRGGAVGVVDKDESRPTVDDGSSDGITEGVSDRVTEPSLERK